MITIINFYEGDKAFDGMNTFYDVTEEFLLEEIRKREDMLSSDETVWVETITAEEGITRWVYVDGTLKSFEQKHKESCIS